MEDLPPTLVPRARDAPHGSASTRVEEQAAGGSEYEKHILLTPNGIR